MNGLRIKRILMSVFAVGLLAAFADASDGWRFKWPALVPEVAERSFEPTRRVVRDENLTMEVVCGRAGHFRFS